MGLQKQNPAGANGGACENTHLARRDVQQDTIVSPKHQQPYRLVATVAKSAREQFRIRVRDFGGIAKSEIRVFELDGLGNWRPTPKAIVIGRGAIAAVIAGLCECEARL